MPVRTTSHFTWQVLRAAKRSKTPPTGRALRLNFNRTTKDGSFLTALVTEGLLVRATGTADKPFEATYALTPKGEHAAEYGEYEYQLPAPVETPEAKPSAPKKKPKRK